MWSLTEDERRSGEWSAASAGSEIFPRIQPWDPGLGAVLKCTWRAGSLPRPSGLPP